MSVLFGHVTVKALAGFLTRIPVDQATYRPGKRGRAAFMVAAKANQISNTHSNFDKRSSRFVYAK